MNVGIHQEEWLAMIRHARAAPEDVQVWTCLTGHQERHIKSMFETLPRDEQDRAARFGRQQDRENFVLGRFLVRKICAEWFEVTGSELDIGVTAAGRPFLQRAGPFREPRFDFNVSHSGTCTLVAWSPQQRVGVDVERLATDHALDMTRLAERLFSPPERRMLARLAPRDRALTFYKIWVRKEAVLKAEGWGISDAMSSISVVTECQCEYGWADEIVCDRTGPAWTVAELPAGQGYVAALAKQLSVRHSQYPALEETFRT